MSSQPTTPPGGRHAPATLRNRTPILAVLQQILPGRGVVLEVASGTGEHAVYFASRLPNQTWQPSDVDPDMLVSIAAWARTVEATNLRPAIRLDVLASPAGTLSSHGLSHVAAVVNINMIHIAPWAACEGLLDVARSALVAGGVLYLYGPFKRGGCHTARSNAAFDESLREQDPRWGVRNLEEVVDAAAARRLAFVEAIAMPANNLSVVFRHE